MDYPFLDQIFPKIKKQLNKLESKKFIFVKIDPALLIPRDRLYQTKIKEIITELSSRVLEP